MVRPKPARARSCLGENSCSGQHDDGQVVMHGGGRGHAQLRRTHRPQFSELPPPKCSAASRSAMLQVLVLRHAAFGMTQRRSPSRTGLTAKTAIPNPLQSGAPATRSIRSVSHSTPCRRIQSSNAFKQLSLDRTIVQWRAGSHRVYIHRLEEAHCLTHACDSHAGARPFRPPGAAPAPWPARAPLPWPAAPFEQYATRPSMPAKATAPQASGHVWPPTTAAPGVYVCEQTAHLVLRLHAHDAAAPVDAGAVVELGLEAVHLQREIVATTQRALKAGKAPSLHTPRTAHRTAQHSTARKDECAAANHTSAPNRAPRTSLANSRWSSFFTPVSARAVAVFWCTTAPRRALPCGCARGAGMGGQGMRRASSHGGRPHPDA